ncbi:fungal-specific transcription factor domain-containing protein [Cantharellus anzutake]|uniref:fungal-specific transcription factor domain-containing protein n=1 Tax=Cantharellus anzutake TaxID=1750568 RepID=UPI001906915E|nr:fungal-specific transcription factor domain-containing protein [Cantharellus anzutake]KAF8339604.1 fungal-specific transcription factor domain-containing protein [Cantharellus anzutake]
MPPARVKKDGSASPTEEDRPDDALRDSNGDKPKRKRQSQSCDACRARKVKCTREGLSRDGSEDQHTSCKHCIALGIKCTYEYQPKKRGPPNLYLRRLQEAAAALQAQQSQHIPQTPPATTPLSPFSLDVNGVSHSTLSRNSVAGVSALNTTASSSNGYIDHSLHNLLPGSYSAAADNYNYGVDSSNAALSVVRPSSSSGRSDRNMTASPMQTSQSLRYASPGNFHHSAPQVTSWGIPSPSPSVSTVSLSPSPCQLLRTYPPLDHFTTLRHSLDHLPVSRERIMEILQLFFSYVYPLTPCIHKPTFMADIATHREETDPLFFALILSTVASTLVQVPRSYLPFFDRPTVRKLALYCSEASRLITVAGYDNPCSMQVVIRYFDMVYHFCEGNDATSHACFGEAAHIAVTLHMHEEASYENLDPIEAEIRRRVFWLLFGADKSMAILLGRPICLRDEDCTVHFPKDVDDEYITFAGVQEQPRGTTAIVSGLNYITRIFALLGEILVRIRVDKRAPPRGSLATDRLAEIRALHTRIINALAHAPGPLKLKTRNAVDPAKGSGVHLPGTSTADYGGLGSRHATFVEVRNFFHDPHASRENAGNAYLVMQANLYVTQQLVRFVIEQYRDELITMIRLQAGPNVDTSELMRGWHMDDREAVASDLLNVLHSIPIQAIATNGPSLVHKVRFVASTLLDAVRKVETAPASAARANAYLWDFLSILSEIERNYLLDDERDESSGPANAMVT